MDRNEELRQWFEIADTDLAAAEYLTTMRWPRPDEIICFHCRQAVEKYLKSFLFENYIEPPKIHDLLKLLKMCEKLSPSFGALLPQCNFLNRYSGSPRCPAEVPVSEGDASLAISYTKTVKDFVEKLREKPCS